MMHRAAVTVSELSDMADPGREERGDHIAASVRVPAVRVASLTSPGEAQPRSEATAPPAPSRRGAPPSAVIARSAATKQPRAPTPGLHPRGPGLLRLRLAMTA